MISIILFTLSFVLVFTSSYFLASCFEIHKYCSALVYLILISFAQIVATFELISLFNGINNINALILNILFFILITIFWVKKGKPLYKPKIKEFTIKMFKAIKGDKILVILTFCFFIFIISSVILAIIVPVNSWDAQAYHVNRAAYWLFQGNLSHFEITDGRNTVMPINSELLYLWVLTFLKNDIGFGCFSFAGYILSIVSLFGILEILGFSNRSKAWSIYIYSSLAGVIVQASSTETDLIIGALAISAVYLFLISFTKGLSKFQSIFSIYLSTLALALMIGTKTTGFFILPAFGVFVLLYMFKYEKNSIKRYLKLYSLFFIINFMIFASYNYILNLINYGNMMGTYQITVIHEAKHTLKGFIANIIRHAILMLDFSGLKYNEYIQGFIFALQNSLLTFLHIPLDYNVGISEYETLNKTLIDPFVGVGLIGIIVFIPFSIIALIQGTIFHRSKKNFVIGLFSLMYLVAFLTMSFFLIYMVFSVRFLLSFVILASPIFVLSYTKNKFNFFKYLITFYAMYYLVLVSTHITARNFMRITRLTYEGVNYSTLRTKLACSDTNLLENANSACILASRIREKIPPNSKIGIVASFAYRLFSIKMLEKYGYKFENIMIEKIEDYDLSQYDYIIFAEKAIVSNGVLKFDTKRNNYKVIDKKLIFKPDVNVQCVYFDTEHHLILGQSKGKPITTLCWIPSSYLNTQGFYQVGQIFYQGAEKLRYDIQDKGKKLVIEDPKTHIKKELVPEGEISLFFKNFRE